MLIRLFQTIEKKKGLKNLNDIYSEQEIVIVPQITLESVTNVKPLL